MYSEYDVELLTGCWADVGGGFAGTTDESGDLREALHEAETKQSITPLIKQELKYKILARRESEGATDIEVVFESPKQYALTAEERQKIERRKQRNRISANNSRIKRRERLKELEAEAERLTRDNNKLVAEINKLTKVRTAFKHHIGTCKTFPRANDRPSNICFTAGPRHSKPGYSWSQNTGRCADVLPEVHYSACQQVLG